jgi:hypothetical protein
MTTNVYMSNRGSEDIALELVSMGPDSWFDSSFSGLVASVPVGANNLQVLAISRAPALGPIRPPLTMSELRISANGRYAGSFVVLLDGHGRPLKSAIYFGARGPGSAMARLVSDRNAHAISFETPAQRIRIGFTARANGLFDDLYLDVSLQPTDRWSNAHAARDDNLHRVILLAIDGANRTHLFTAPFDAATPTFTEITLPIDEPDPSSNELFLIDNAFSPQQPLWAGGITVSGKLWLMRTDGVARQVIDLQPPGTNIAALTISDAFVIGSSYGAELFLTIQNDDHSYRPFKAILQLGTTPTLASGGWTDWGTIAARKPSYVRALDARYLCVPRPGTIFGVNLQYAKASTDASDWGIWRGMSALPSDGTINAVTAFSWSGKEIPRTECAAAFRSSDNNLYGGTFTNQSGWTKSNVQPDGDALLPIDGTNFVPLLYVDSASKQLRYLRWAVKEFGPVAGGTITAGSAPPCFAGFHYDTPGGNRQYAVWQGQSAPVVHDLEEEPQ